MRMKNRVVWYTISCVYDSKYSFDINKNHYHFGTYDVVSEIVYCGFETVPEAREFIKIQIKEKRVEKGPICF